MDKIVETGYKIDLHIHSAFSRGKDKGKVAFNTLENIDTLIEKLNENRVQICAITDHDIFDYNYYKKLKEAEKDKNLSIVKVFPGIEFSVVFRTGEEDKVVHVIAIFNDEDDDKIKSIADKLLNADKGIDYDCKMAFSEEKFLAILRSIDIDTVLIAHQKSTLSSKQPYKNDIRTLGEDKFLEFIHTEYFEAFEFKNRKNEVFNKNFMAMNQLTEDIRFITGSDCHDWREYPKIDSKDKEEFKYTYIKCLPNFRGLVMAITDHHRIKTVNSFFNPDATYTKTIDMKIGDVEYHIPLSRGINVIIGDNSIGKSLLLHKLTGYRKKQVGLLKDRVITGYKNYLKKNNVDIRTEIPESDIFYFDMQGEIREKFEQKKLKSDDYLKQYYPAPINSAPYKEKVQRKLNGIYRYLEEKFAIEKKIDQLGVFSIIDDEYEQAESLIFIGSVSRNNKIVDGFSSVNSAVENIIEKLKTLIGSDWIEEDDTIEINDIINKLESVATKYNQKKQIAEYENTKIGMFQAAFGDYKQKYLASVSDSQKKLSSYNEHMTSAVENIYDIIVRRKNNVLPSLKLDKETVGIATARVYDYEFNSRLGITEIPENYIDNLFKGCLKKDKKPVVDMTQKDLEEALLRFQGTTSEALSYLKDQVNNKIVEDFSNVFTITQADTDRTQELSAGFNSKIYFDMLSYATHHNGIYIIDQPEDNISQKSIREYLLNRFRIMGENRQVIIVTHNPQFIVNLDVDNVIFMGKENNRFYIYSGALEYRDEEYNILDIISNHIEGGLDTLKRRWKRYEKGSSI